MEERNKPEVISLGERNGQDGHGRVPKNFHRKAGRILGSFRGDTKEGEKDVKKEDDFDIEKRTERIRSRPTVFCPRPLSDFK